MRRYGGAMRKLSKLAVDSTKNIFTLDTSVASLTVLVVTVALGVKPAGIDELDTTKTYYVEDNASIRFFNIVYSLYNRSGNLPGQEKVTILLRKNEGGVLGTPTLAQVNALGAQAWKNRVFEVWQAKPPAPGGIPMVLGPVRIPKRFQKTSINDVWELVIANNSSGSVDGCGLAIYKWYK